MDKASIQEGLKKFVDPLSSQTYLNTFRVQARNSLLGADMGTRANSIWKMAEYIVAPYDGDESRPLADYLKGWANLVKNYKNQYLIIEVSENNWEMYDSSPKKLGGNDYIEEYLKRRASKEEQINVNVCKCYRPYITAIKSKPFLLLAGISGTGKSRIVRELARACWEVGSDEFNAQKPRNFEMVQVKPNWHDSSELLGYISRIAADKEGNGVTFVAGDFIKFVARAWEDPDVPYFLCLDEMNLAPVEQYFAEYLSVIESRKATDMGVVTDPLLKKSVEPWYFNLCAELTSDDNLRQQFLNEGICIPQNLIVVGTVNMDETTFSFSRKVLDRAMTIEMNEVNLWGGLDNRHEIIGKLSNAELVGTAVEGVDVYSSNKAVCDTVLKYLDFVNRKLEGTPFKIAYRTRNEFLLYVVNNLPYTKYEEGNEFTPDFVIARALDEITNMKILSRIEGDETKVPEKFLKGLSVAIKEQLDFIGKTSFNIEKTSEAKKSISLAKLNEMIQKLSSGYTSFWS